MIDVKKFMQRIVDKIPSVSTSSITGGSIGSCTWTTIDLKNNIVIMFGVSTAVNSYSLTSYGGIAYYPSQMKQKLPIRIDVLKSVGYVSIGSSGADWAGSVRLFTGDEYSEITYHHLNGMVYTPTAGNNTHRYLVIGHKA